MMNKFENIKSQAVHVPSFTITDSSGWAHTFHNFGVCWAHKPTKTPHRIRLHDDVVQATARGESNLYYLNDSITATWHFV